MAVCVCLSVCPSQASVLSKRLKIRKLIVFFECKIVFQASQVYELFWAPSCFNFWSSCLVICKVGHLSRWTESLCDALCYCERRSSVDCTDRILKTPDSHVSVSAHGCRIASPGSLWYENEIRRLLIWLFHGCLLAPASTAWRAIFPLHTSPSSAVVTITLALKLWQTRQPQTCLLGPCVILSTLIYSGMGITSECLHVSMTNVECNGLRPRYSTWRSN